MDTKKLELLAPAGNRAAFDAALNSGADAIYLGIEKYSARRGAANFSFEELESAVKDAHLRGARVYVAFNTLIADSELSDAAQSIAQISNAGADAVIVQDWGVFELVKRIAPHLRVHSSTQMNTHNIQMAKFIEEHGASRITLARELAIPEIADIVSSTSVEIETFIHGALCFSYSGQCLFSSMVGNRSGNRGMCPQACRLSYDLSVAAKKEEVWPTPGRHILSTRDLSGIRLIPELAQAGVTALKIEGRMKSPEYVATVVRVYRRAIDRYRSDPENYNVSDDEINELKEAFTRGFTEGYLKDIRDSRLMSFERPSDRGVLIGRVTYLDVYTGKLGLQLKQELCVGDEIEVWVTKGGRVRRRVDKLLVNDKPVTCAPVDSKAVVIIEGKRHKINTGDRVFRVHSEKLAREAKAAISGQTAPRIPIAMSAHIEVGKPVALSAQVNEAFGGQEASLRSDFLAEKGERRMLTEDDVVAQLNRLGNTVYEAESWDLRVGPDVMVPLGRLNELRRQLVEELNAARLKAFMRPSVSVKQAKRELAELMEPEPLFKRGRAKLSLAADVSSIEQARAATINGADWLYVRPGLSRFGPIDFDELSEMRATGIKIALASSNILHQSELVEQLKFMEENAGRFDAFLVDNFGVLRALKPLEKPLFLDYHINVFNRPSARFFKDEGASRICLSVELDMEQLREIAGSISVGFEAIVQGWLEVMTAEHCVPSASKKSCQACTSKSFFIADEKGFRFPVEQDSRCRSHIYNSREFYLLPNAANLADTGLSSLRLLLNRYEPRIAGNITATYREAIDLVAAGSRDLTSVLKKADQLYHRPETSTTGHFFRAVQ